MVEDGRGRPWGRGDYCVPIVRLIALMMPRRNQSPLICNAALTLNSEMSMRWVGLLSSLLRAAAAAAAPPSPARGDARLEARFGAAAAACPVELPGRLLAALPATTLAATLPAPPRGPGCSRSRSRSSTRSWAASSSARTPEASASEAAASRLTPKFMCPSSCARRPGLPPLPPLGVDVDGLGSAAGAGTATGASCAGRPPRPPPPAPSPLSCMLPRGASRGPSSLPTLPRSFVLLHALLPAKPVAEPVQGAQRGRSYSP